MAMLEVQGLSAVYGQHRALNGVSLRVAPGEIVVILGANGAGKSTLLKAIAGICEGKVEGSVTMAGEPVQGLAPHKVVERGIALVPEGRGIFGDLTVRENLTLCANPQRAREDQAATFDRLVRLFPKLTDRAGQVARTMSGGEQQMVAIGRAMMSNPVILMLDEPSLGLSPLLSKELFQNLKQVKAAGLGILLVEQNARLSLAIADRGYLLENGRILREDRASVLANDPAVQAAYLGGGGSKAPARAAVPVADHAPVPELPPIPVPRAAPAGVSAAQVVGLDLNALVAAASARAAPAPTPLGPAQVQAAVAARSDRLGTVLSGIEAAARNAARPVPLAPLPPLRAPALREATRTPQPTPAAPPATTPTPGKVEVWRRRPGSDQFDRMES
jgi:branched-chain amino acid transport system ATP-binding protein